MQFLKDGINGFLAKLGRALGRTPLDEIQRTLLRHQIACKWDTIDYLERGLPIAENELICPLCGHSNRLDATTRFESFCIFDGGRLIRFQCAGCELIFGPLKVLRLTPAQLTREYEWHYMAFSEGDSTKAEMQAFNALGPKKSGRYLNWGSGGWSMTLQNLRREGFNVVGFEPHQSATKEGEGIITSRDELASQRFDGIFSNNVLEHLRYPIEELQLMASLLTAGGRMAHATPCYEYLYEYTRFHLFFYLGRSKKVLAEKVGLDLQEFVVDGEFMCGIFAPRPNAP